MRVCLVLADRIIQMLDDAGASESEKIAAVEIARLLVPLSRDSLYEKSITDGKQSNQLFG